MTLYLLCPCGARLTVPATPQGYTRASGWYARHREHYRRQSPAAVERR